MAPDPTNVRALVQQYYKSDDEGREQLFQDLYASHYNGPCTSPDDLANTLQSLLLSLNILPTTAGAETMYIVVVQELCWAMQRFCLATPPGIDYAWNATMLLISLLGRMLIEPGQFDIHAFVADNLEYWVAEFASDDHCDMTNVTSSPVRDDDASVISVTQSQWDDDSDEQLANLALNHEARKRCIVHKVIAARAVKDGFAPTGPRDTAFPGACELRYIESALQCKQNDTTPNGDRCQSSGDAMAATFQLRACAKSLLASLPGGGCEFYKLWEMAPVEAGEEGRTDGQQAGKREFALMAYAGLALENLRDPKDETSEELFSWASVVF